MTTVYQQKGLDCFPLIERSLLDNLDIRSRFGGYFEIPDTSFDPLRKQYNARRIIDMVIKQHVPSKDLLLGMVDVDIYVHRMNFIFGLAQPLRRAAVVSSFRLAGQKRAERVAKEVIHETGHLLGLEHCPLPHCVMHFSNTVEDTDHKKKRLCVNCRRIIEK